MDQLDPMSEKLLLALRDAINSSILASPNVSYALAAIEEAGRRVEIGFDLVMRDSNWRRRCETQHAVAEESATFIREDDVFLESLGIEGIHARSRREVPFTEKMRFQWSGGS